MSEKREAADSRWISFSLQYRLGTWLGRNVAANSRFDGKCDYMFFFFLSCKIPEVSCTLILMIHAAFPLRCLSAPTAQNGRTLCNLHLKSAMLSPVCWYTERLLPNQHPVVETDICLWASVMAATDRWLHLLSFCCCRLCPGHSRMGLTFFWPWQFQCLTLTVWSYFVINTNLCIRYILNSVSL